MLKIGIFGAGHLGKIHIRQWLTINEAQIIGFYDPDEAKAAEAIQEFGIPRYPSMDALIQDADALDIISTTTTHYEIARNCILACKPFFVEKPLAHSLEEAAQLTQLAREANLVCQVGHVERFNPAYLALEEENLQPLFIEAHRLAEFSPRGTDVSVILDLMVHDIDIVMHLVKSPVKRISASGVPLISEAADIVNARIEFNNGCVANLTASRISLKKMRKMRLFQRDAYIGIDFLEKRTEVIRLRDGPGEAEKGKLSFPLHLPSGDQKIISVDTPAIKNINAIRMELEEFTASVLYQKPVRVTIDDGFQAMEVAHQILSKMNPPGDPLLDLA